MWIYKTGLLVSVIGLELSVSGYLVAFWINVSYLINIDLYKSA